MTFFSGVLKRYLHHIRKAKSCFIGPYIITYDLTRIIILYRYELIIAPAYDKDIGGIRLPELIRLGCLMPPFLGRRQFRQRPGRDEVILF